MQALRAMLDDPDQPLINRPIVALNPPGSTFKLVTAAAALALGVAAFSGCSTITQSDTQSLALTASYQGRAVEADCKLVNDRGSWEAKSPANVPVRKSGEDLDVTCKKEGLPDGLLKAISRAAGSMYGNIVFGGGIGAIISSAGS